jgi:hypothetical protein
VRTTPVELVGPLEDGYGDLPTLQRTYRQIDAVTLAGLWDALVEVRADVWSAIDVGERVAPWAEDRGVDQVLAVRRTSCLTSTRRWSRSFRTQARNGTDRYGVRVPSNVLLRGSHG